MSKRLSREAALVEVKRAQAKLMVARARYRAARQPPRIRINDDKLRAAIGANIKKERELRGITQGDLALAIGIARTSIVNIEQGKQSITIARLLQFSAVLGITPLGLLDGGIEWQRK